MQQALISCITPLSAAELLPASRATWLPIGMEEVAAGDGAFRTWMVRAVSPIRKSWTNVPSGSTAWARTPDGRGEVGQLELRAIALAERQVRDF